MAINFTAPVTTEMKPRIIVIGVGGAGGNAVNNMIRSGLDGVEFLVANTDAQSLAQSEAMRKIQLGTAITQGLGSGAQPEVGRSAAEETLAQIEDHLENTHMAFITAGMGGGTGTGAAPVIAKACQERNILTVGVVTKPFKFEGSHRMATAEKGIEELQRHVDTLLVIPNQNLFRVATEKTTFADAFSMADRVLHSGVRGITDLMVAPGLINLDFADVRTVMREMGKAMMGTGEAEGEDRANAAAEGAINNPLLEDASMNGARGVLINITGGPDLTLFEVEEAAERIRTEVAPDANIIVGSALEESLNGRIRVSIVATGIDTIADMATDTDDATAAISVLNQTVAVDDRPQAEDLALMQRRNAPVEESAPTQFHTPLPHINHADDAVAGAKELSSDETDALEASFQEEQAAQQAYAQQTLQVDGANALAAAPESFGGDTDAYAGATAERVTADPYRMDDQVRSAAATPVADTRRGTGSSLPSYPNTPAAAETEAESYIVDEARQPEQQPEPAMADNWAGHAMPDADPAPVPARDDAVAERPKRGLFSRVTNWRHRGSNLQRAEPAAPPLRSGAQAIPAGRTIGGGAGYAPTEPESSAAAHPSSNQPYAPAADGYPAETYSRYDDSPQDDAETPAEGEDLAIPSFLRRQAN